MTSLDMYCAGIIHRVTSRAVRKDNGCLEYRAGRCKHKYGLISVTIDRVRRVIPAHRALYMATYKCLDLPRSVFIRHSCDNPPCVDISHLARGTAKDNAQDSIARKRRATKHSPHKRVLVFDDATIRAIRDEPGLLLSVARKFNVSPGYVSRLRHRKAKRLVD